MENKYEWTVEELDEHGDIIDSHFYDKFPGVPDDGKHVGLVRTTYATKHSQRGYLEIKPGDRIARSWAYVENGRLSDTFDDGEPVPKRFTAEVSSAKAA